MQMVRGVRKLLEMVDMLETNLRLHVRGDEREVPLDANCLAGSAQDRRIFAGCDQKSGCHVLFNEASADF